MKNHTALAPLEARKTAAIGAELHRPDRARADHFPHRRVLRRCVTPAKPPVGLGGEHV